MDHGLKIFDRLISIKNVVYLSLSTSQTSFNAAFEFDSKNSFIIIFLFLIFCKSKELVFVSKIKGNQSFHGSMITIELF